MINKGGGGSGTGLVTIASVTEVSSGQDGLRGGRGAGQDLMTRDQEMDPTRSGGLLEYGFTRQDAGAFLASEELRSGGEKQSSREAESSHPEGRLAHGSAS